MPLVNLKRDRSEYSTEILADELSKQDPPEEGNGNQGDDQGQGQDQDQGQGQDPFADDGGTGIVIDAENDNGEPLDAAQISEQGARDCCRHSERRPNCQGSGQVASQPRRICG